MRHILAFLSLLILIAGSFYLGVLWCESKIPDLRETIIFLEYCRDGHLECAERARIEVGYRGVWNTTVADQIRWAERYQEHIERLGLIR